MSHMYIETEYCTWSDMSYSFRTSVYLTCIVKQNIVHIVTRHTVSEHEYFSHVYWTRMLYMEWEMIKLQNISISHMHIETEYCTCCYIWYSFRKSVFLTCIMKQNNVNGVTRVNFSEHRCISHAYWNEILHM